MRKLIDKHKGKIAVSSYFVGILVLLTISYFIGNPAVRKDIPLIVNLFGSMFMGLFFIGITILLMIMIGGILFLTLWYWPKQIYNKSK